ncbi:hypothetical protein EV356DRAFT_512257 [Viridothelium virens]|uniref:Uncharacterized protein n=1 Tax=Viridothelium virens TaxID=1048519 RepID=A0A6A6HHP0_VIRVR|nr:hypothetical protein EV356DRAFT_512257 [Viridothelium virens]
MMKCNSFLAILNLGAMVVAQTTDPTLQQASQILEGQVSVARAFTANPTVVSLFSAISTALPSDFSATPAYESIISQYSAASNGGIDVALLTSSVSVATQAWETLLPSSLKDAWDSFETSFISDVQMVEATPVGITPGATLSPSVTSSPSNNSSSNSTTFVTSRPTSNSTSTSTSTTGGSSSLGSTGASSSSPSSSPSSSSNSGAGPTNVPRNAGVGAALGVLGIAAALL